jgi:hypothetical protein
MPDSKYEEAKRCPKCGLPGEVVSTLPSRDSRGRPCKVETIKCQNYSLDGSTALCTWSGTTWIVQINQDGSIPDPNSSPGPKQFEFNSTHETMGRHYLESLQDDTDPDAEMRGQF